MSVRVMTVGVMTVGVMSVGEITVGVMRQPHKTKAEILAKYFSIVFTEEPEGDIPNPYQ